jgi:hypothetical protein
MNLATFNDAAVAAANDLKTAVDATPNAGPVTVPQSTVDALNSIRQETAVLAAKNAGTYDPNNPPVVDP